MDVRPSSPMTTCWRRAVGGLSASIPALVAFNVILIALHGVHHLSFIRRYDFAAPHAAFAPHPIASSKKKSRPSLLSKPALKTRESPLSVQRERAVAPETNEGKDDEDASQYYWNLSCPLEMSSQSCIYQAVGDNTTESDAYRLRAHLSLDRSRRSNARTAVSAVMGPRGAFANRNVFFIGDSMTRQLFISFACLGWENNIASHTVSWVDETLKHEPGGAKRYMSHGPHSKFGQEPTTLVLANGGQMTYLSTSEGLLRQIREGKRYLRDRIRDCRKFNDGEIVVGNGGVWPGKEGRTQILPMFQNLASTCFGVGSDEGNDTATVTSGGKAQGKFSDYKKPPWFVYFMTPQQSFVNPASNGEFRGRTGGVKECAANVTVNNRGDEELKFFGGGGRTFRLIKGPDYSHLGPLHLGGGDCTHYCQPGVPDEIAAEISLFLSMSL